MVWCDNIDYDIMLDTLKGIPFSEEYSQSLNTLILEMLHAYYWIHLLQPLYTFQNFLLKNNPLF